MQRSHTVADKDGQSFIAQVHKDNQEIPFYNLLGMKILELDIGAAGISMMVGHEFTNQNGMFHGGAAATLADVAMGAAVRTLGVRGVLIDINASYFAPVKKGDTVIAKAWVIHKGRSIVGAECEIKNGKDVLTIKANGRYKLTAQLKQNSGTVEWVPM